MSTRLQFVLLSAFIGWLPGALADPGHGARQEYRTTAQSQLLLRSDLQASAGKEAQILQIELPPGWAGERHFHTGDVFVYVLEGEFVIELDGEEPMRFGAGEVYHEAVNVTMQASNGSAADGARLLLLQVGNKDEPLMIRAD